MTAPIVRDFLRTFIDVDPFLEAALGAHLLVNDEDVNVHFRLNAAILEYTMAERARVLSPEWWEQATPEQVETVNPAPETMMQLNAICGFHNIDRVVIYLYLHAWIKDGTQDTPGYSEAIYEMDQLIHSLNNV